MTFEEILDQAVAMLQRRSRVTYRMLKLQFQLDDEQLEALKEELIYGQQLAVDEEGRVLVWTAGADKAPVPAQPLPPRRPPRRLHPCPIPRPISPKKSSTPAIIWKASASR